MAEGVRLYTGTGEGLFVWRSRNGGWEAVGREFKDQVVEAVAGDARRPGRAYVALAYDGVYRSDDGGQRWTRVLVDDGRAIAVDPHDVNVVYAGTEPVGLYRSEDGGDTWESLSAGLLALPESVRKQWWTPF